MSPVTIFVLGGPGSGKGTQSARLAKAYGLGHLSMGELFREEVQRPGSPHAESILKNMETGNVGPPELSCALLKAAMARDEAESNGFVIDGFPRKMPQALLCTTTIGSPSLVIFLDCPEEMMKERLLARAKMAARLDDGVEVTRKRFRAFEEDTRPVIGFYGEKGLLVRTDGGKDVESVWNELNAEVGKRLGVCWC